jgi:hypothetical protein|tara:strand:- start:576 stop:797 length:222 start_codon:yes stop_codon:yes gene_type:complete
MEFIKLSQEVVAISKKLESISKKMITSIQSREEAEQPLKSPSSVKSKPVELPPAGIRHSQPSTMWQQSLRKRN